MCIYKKRKHLENAIVLFDDGKLYQCNSNDWVPYNDFDVIVNSTNKTPDNAGELIHFSITQTENNSFNLELITLGEVFELDKFDDLRQINIELSDEKVNVLVHYKSHESYKNYNSTITDTSRVFGSSAKFLEYRLRGSVTFYLRNMGGYNNNYVVWDRRTGYVVFNGLITAWNQTAITTSASDAGYGDISYSKNGNSPYGVPWIKNGDVVNT
jgi:hypothetical protein